MKKVLIANRGEIACRIINICKQRKLKTVAVYSDADANAVHVNMADEAFHLGASRASDSYLNIKKLMEIANISNADAIHPGYGFLAESSKFAEKVIESGFTWIGPSPKSIALMGDKKTAREVANRAGVPVLTDTKLATREIENGGAHTDDELVFPILVKAAAGGGGIGMQIANTADELPGAVERTKTLALKAFGNDEIYFERFIKNAKHIEIQVFGFGNQKAIHFGERDCSSQRRYQKVIEESPAPTLERSIVNEMTEHALRICQEVDYKGAGTVEFIFDTVNQEYFFLEMNTRIQVEHSVTDMATDSDLIGMQIDLALNPKSIELPSNRIPKGSAIECRIYAEKPSKKFIPSPGKLETFDYSGFETGVRFETGYKEGDEISVFYDPLIAKIICHEQNREDTISKLVRNLKLLKVSGISTNIKFLIELLETEDFKSGKIHTNFITQNY